MSEEMEEKRPRLLWIVVVAVVAAALAVFVLVQSSRMAPQPVPARPAAAQRTVSATPPPRAPAWPVEDTTRAAVADTFPAAAPPVEASQAPEPAGEAVSTPEVRSATRPVSPPPAGGERSDARPATQAAAQFPVAPATDDRPLVVPTSDEGPYVVQIGSFRDEKVARGQMTRLEAYGYQAWVEPVEVPGKGAMYRVRIGGFATGEDAERVAASLGKALGTKCWVGKR
jgi:cell division septation protein DedD